MTFVTSDNRLVQIHGQAAGEKSRVMKRASMVTLAGVSVLIAIKAAAWGATGSLSLLSSLVDSVMDVLASLANFCAIRYALVPPDDEHRFGHGKAEYISGMAQAMFIAISAGLIGLEAIRRFLDPVPVEQGAAGIAVMLVSIVITLGMVAYQKRAIALTDSTAVKADYVHYAMDVLANGAVIVALLLVMLFGWTWADPLFALGIAGYILYGAWEVGSTSFNNLMDREFAEQERVAIADAVLAHPEVRAVQELKTRRSGILSFVQLTITLDGHLTLVQAHDITDAVEAAVQELYPHADVMVHAEPV